MKIATSAQLRAARNALGWSLERLSKESGVSLRTLIRYEDQTGVPANRGGNLERVLNTLESAGIEFIGSPDDRPGIRIGPRQTSPE
ncbi:MAG: helix-turn-helix domain-containing protein [Roseicyclus sp.]|uniref:helix-turn-helix domain-containing protein n=1 Tax=Roseicyclus sp. TaxID=1914329 RepID=UPI003A852BBA